MPEASSSSSRGAAGAASFGQGKGKNRKKKGGKEEDGGRGAGVMSNAGWKNALRPLRRQPLLEAMVGMSLSHPDLSCVDAGEGRVTNDVDDIKETNEFINDEISQSDLLSHDEINALREQGVSADDMIRAQMERHDRFDLKTEFSKEKWRQRKEKK